MIKYFPLIFIASSSVFCQFKNGITIDDSLKTDSIFKPIIQYGNHNDYKIQKDDIKGEQFMYGMVVGLVPAGFVAASSKKDVLKKATIGYAVGSFSAIYITGFFHKKKGSLIKTFCATSFGGVVSYLWARYVAMAMFKLAFSGDIDDKDDNEMGRICMAALSFGVYVIPPPYFGSEIYNRTCYKNKSVSGLINYNMNNFYIGMPTVDYKIINNKKRNIETTIVLSTLVLN